MPTRTGERTNVTTDMTRAELALLLSLGSATVAHAGRLATEARYRDVDENERRAITMKIEDVLTDVIVGLRLPGPPPTTEDIAQIMHEVAHASLVAILGDPPTTDEPPALH